ncbi:MAG TPA: hypothetical protein PK821_06205 [Victivallales bacterium]|nr:hypothetical protein [Victivallales bacterium]
MGKALTYATYCKLGQSRTPNQKSSGREKRKIARNRPQQEDKLKNLVGMARFELATF